MYIEICAASAALFLSNYSCIAENCSCVIFELVSDCSGIGTAMTTPDSKPKESWTFTISAHSCGMLHLDAAFRPDDLVKTPGKSS